MTEIFMPKAGMDMKEGRLIRWLKEVGDPVEKDEPVMEIETDKITMEAEAPGSGILLAKTVEEDTWVPVLSVIGYIGEPGEKIPELRQPAPKHRSPLSRRKRRCRQFPAAQRNPPPWPRRRKRAGRLRPGRPRKERLPPSREARSRTRPLRLRTVLFLPRPTRRKPPGKGDWI